MKHVLLYLLAMVLVAGGCFSCKDHEHDSLPQGYGYIQFEFVRNNVYALSSLSNVKTVKVVLVNQDAERIELPSLSLSGTEDLIASTPYALPAGHYVVMSYRCFDLQADLIEDLDITLTRDNEFDVEAGQCQQFSLPVKVKQVLTVSNLYNVLYGLCMEIVGPDKSKWPKSWNFDSGEVDPSWAGIEFEWNPDPTEVVGIVIDGEELYNYDSDTGEAILCSLPEFKHMKRLPACIADLTTLDGITIRNCDMEELCPELQHSKITSLNIYNTKLRSFPEELGQMPRLCDVWIEGNQLLEFPTCLTEIKGLYAFALVDEPGVAEVPASIANWSENLSSLRISGTSISSLPDVFQSVWKVSTLSLSDNRNLSTLPASLGMARIPYADDGSFSWTSITGLELDGCAFTSIPEVAKRERMQVLSMRNNRITSVSKSDFDAMPDLQALYLDGNALGSFPALTNPQLGFLSLNGCGLHKADIDISGLPKLRSYYFYCDE